ncbi:hypothetical protein LS74_010130 [Helicobacter magdeburgensis]|uniref:Uncharacterized protein n=1 Tax=Helicobacter magdeburgensis TaxID=471858 RepID=A0A4U8SWL4_9HELI|nr:hypothetical protein [Helicobacter magdeburgensis]TLD91138.1 hypothetical protein LS74_010130 [Helicobacter magdeburgensis]
MGAIKNILADLENAIRTRNFKDMNPHTKKISLLTLVIFILFIIMLFVMGGDNTETQNQITAGYEQSQNENEQNKDENTYTAPQIDEEALKKAREESQAQADKLKANNPFVAENKNADKADPSSIPDLSSQNLTQQEQEEAIKEIAKKQKPDDMIAFLKEAQNKFNFLKTQKRFKYDMKNYQVGDIFLWWEIEEITHVYIRFRDDDYSYNLRFLEDFE